MKQRINRIKNHVVKHHELYIGLIGGVTIGYVVKGDIVGYDARKIYMADSLAKHIRDCEDIHTFTNHIGTFIITPIAT